MVRWWWRVEGRVRVGVGGGGVGGGGGGGMLDAAAAGSEVCLVWRVPLFPATGKKKKIRSNHVKKKQQQVHESKTQPSRHSIPLSQEISGSNASVQVTLNDLCPRAPLTPRYEF